jgi:uncharacterized protein YidB (DUF937 family)
MAGPQSPSVFDTLVDVGRLDATDASLLDALVERLESKGGNEAALRALVDQCTAAGYGAAVRSWVGPGQPAPIPPDGVLALVMTGGVLDEAWLQAAATRAGVTPEVAARRYALIIPLLVKTLTPRGSIPSDRVVAVGLASMRRRAAK